MMKKYRNFTEENTIKDQELENFELLLSKTTVSPSDFLL